ncbi:MAG: glycoside hydrolase family 3 protein, partial [Chloroflexota bacterium]|nr:glycoside hydrolase family 3 protein [Chloroflexota bacterium]
MKPVQALPLEQAVGHQLMLAFTGLTPSAGILATLRHHPSGGITLFRSLNVADPAQVRALTGALQAAATATGQPLLLIGADQEGGTLMALAGTTEFPGNMALGATGSTDLAQQTGRAIGRELAAMGVNVNYAPVGDVNSNVHNPVVGTRSFGGDPVAVARLTAALICGLQAAGVAATVKHFPGHGDTSTDSHLGTPVVAHDMARLRAVELPPFAAAVQAGVRLVMTAHIAVPAVTGDHNPATLSPAILRGLLRADLGFDGVIVSDAMNMGAITQGRGLLVDTLASIAAGVDLLLLTDDPAGHAEVYSGLLQATQRGLLDPERVQAAAARVLALKAWIAEQPQPGLEVVACADHQALAATVAAQAVTLVRDTAGHLPLRLAAGARIAAVVPQPADLT